MSSGPKRLETDWRMAVAGISHDLRTRVTRLRLAVELNRMLLRESSALAMLRDLEDIDAILKQLLDFARDEADEPARLQDLNAIVSDVCRRYQLAGQHVKMSLGSVQPIHLRGLAIRRLITNLIDNALRHGGDEAEISTDQRDGIVTIAVADRGPGIRSVNPDELIRPFAREDSARDKPGSGLGLTVVDRIARAHGGSLELKNRPGGGLLAMVNLAAGAPEEFAQKPPA